MPAITIRNVPDEVRDQLAARAALAGQSMQEYVRAHLIEIATKPSMHEVMERVRQRLAETPSELTSAAIVDYLREDRGP